MPHTEADEFDDLLDEEPLLCPCCNVGRMVWGVCEDCGYEHQRESE